jgi:hypothetical protein
LARDAASRLPDGIGTRGDIIELMKHSQWLKTDSTDTNGLNSVISGALDRLHYEDDSCVKYDAEKKLWIYMHYLRTLDHGDWQPMMNDVPNCFDSNSFNPYDSEEKEKMWRASKHIGTGIPLPPTQNYQVEAEPVKQLPVINENSESI